MNINEFVNYCRLHIEPDSGLRQPFTEDIKYWTELGLFKYAPNYYQEDIRIVMALLKQGRDILKRQLMSEHKIKLTANSLASLVQVISCVGAIPTEESLIIERLKESGHISFPGWIGINCHPISWQPMKEPGGGLLLCATKVEPGTFRRRE